LRESISWMESMSFGGLGGCQIKYDSLLENNETCKPNLSSILRE